MVLSSGVSLVLSEGRQEVLSRRASLARGFAGSAAWACLSTNTSTPLQATDAQTNSWRTWLLPTAAALRPASPPVVTDAEIAELIELQERRTTTTYEIVARWGNAPPVIVWTNLALRLIQKQRPSPARAGRALALLHVALYDTVLATIDAQEAHRRPRPSIIDHRVSPIVEDFVAQYAFPSEHAAMAGAAATVLMDSFPDEPAERLAAVAEEAATSRLWAGTNVRSDIEAGLALGRAVGDVAVARGKVDSLVESPILDRPKGNGFSERTLPALVDPPLDAGAGSWRTWSLLSGNALRPPLPPAYGTAHWEAEVAAVRHAVASRTPEEEDAVRFWGGGPGTVTPVGLWIEIARDLIVRYALDLRHAARVLALASTAMADSLVCGWDAKYAYWAARPITVVPDLDVLIPTPPFPSYTSGHSAISAAAATVLGYLFPNEKVALADRAEEAKNSRLWAGIHFPIDNDMGALGGWQIKRLVIATDA